jgi:DNA uptake protein ComE-like DNA-binding protein
VQAVREQTRRVESFRFNPNTVSVEDLLRLGFSQKQAQAIDNYRQKGGRFHRPSDFAKSFVVADSVFARLEPYIQIPLLDINRADSVALLSLPGIGPWFAGKVVEYRGKLGGFSHPEQLMEIYRFDREKYDALKDLITCSAPEPYPLWTLPEADLARHPYISKEEAHGIVLYRQNNPREACTLEGLKKAGVLSAEHAGALSRCILAD